MTFLQVLDRIVLWTLVGGYLLIEMAAEIGWLLQP